MTISEIKQTYRALSLETLLNFGRYTILYGIADEVCLDKYNDVTGIY